MNKLIIFLVQGAILLLIDFHIDRAIIIASSSFSDFWKKFVRKGMWVISGLAIVSLMWYHFADPFQAQVAFRQWIIIWVVIIYFSKIITVLFVLADDVRIGLLRLKRFFYKKKSAGELPGLPITRSKFLAQTALVAGAAPFGTLVFGILSGATDYQVFRKKIILPNLPKAFDGLRIGQLSDIHAGTFYSKVGVRGGVEMMMAEKADVLFFTGDLVNIQTSEVKDYITIFDKLKAPLGVFSVTGNHDYGNYRWWPDDASKQKNFDEMLEAHRLMGFDLLMNEHRFLEAGGDKLAIMGVENWGVGPSHRFPKYGKLNVAHAGTEDAAVKLLLSHDPSHWDAQIRPEFSDIDVTFAGHTHGFQMGVKIGDMRWSPAQYRFKQWAGLYQEANQYLYVNQGFGCIGYPGRIGMPPELTIVELKRA
ncbi:MAG: metallophosphoesterase [Cyclobacteriaceae bacterium]|nr:metallophosphoesterase [Cyclobacteriaceae bacterium]